MVKRLLPIILILFFFLGGGYFLYSQVDAGIAFIIADEHIVLKKVLQENLIVLNSKVTITGTLNKSIILVNSRLDLKESGRIKGSIFCWDSKVFVYKKGMVVGDVFAMDSLFEAKKNSVLKGKVYVVSRDQLSSRPVLEAIIEDKPIRSFMKQYRLGLFVTIFLLSFLHVFWPRQFLRVAYVLYAKPYTSFFWGAVYVVLTMAILLLLAVTLLWIFFIVPLLILILFILLASIVAAAIVFGKFFRKRLFIKKKLIWLEIFLGLIFIWCIRAIPKYGDFFYYLVLLAGYGATIRSLFGTKDIT